MARAELGLRLLGAAAILAVGGVHAQQYYGAYFSSVPTIGTLFLLSFVGAGAVGAVLLAPVRRLAGRLGDVALAFAALGGIGIAVGTFVALLVSEYTRLFGFMESGYRLAVWLTLVFDVLAAALLGAFLLLVVRRARSSFARHGAAPESNRPSRGLHDRTGFEDPLGHQALPLRDQPRRRSAS